MKEVNILEFEILKLIDFRLFVQIDTYVKYSDYLRKYRIKEM
jgi:hypothetical protein